jgi:hypothetical protein
MDGFGSGDRKKCLFVRRSEPEVSSTDLHSDDFKELPPTANALYNNTGSIVAFSRTSSLQSSRTRLGAPPISCSQTVLIHIKPRNDRHWLDDVRRKSRTDLIHISDRTKYQPPTSIPKRMAKRGVSAELLLFQNLGRNHFRAVGRGLLRSPFRPC